MGNLDWDVNADVVKGYTFCKALLREAITTGKPVDFTCEGKVHATYTFDPEKPFVEGIRLKIGERTDNFSYRYLISDPAKSYDTLKGLAELAKEGMNVPEIGGPIRRIVATVREAFKRQQ